MSIGHTEEITTFQHSCSPANQPEMSTFEITAYTETLPNIHLDTASDSQDSDATWIGHTGQNDADVEGAFSRFFQYARKTYMFPDQDPACLTLRKVMFDDEFKIPRPHHDGRYWGKELNAGREAFKVGTVLCGPSTLFWDTSKSNSEVAAKVQHLIAEEMYKRAREAGTDAMDLSVREWATEKLQEMGVPIVRLKSNECVRWVVGDGERAAIHSEPDMSDMPNGRVL